MSTLLQPLLSADYVAIELSALGRAWRPFESSYTRASVCPFLSNEPSLKLVSKAFHEQHQKSQDEYYKKVWDQLSSKSYVLPFLPEDPVNIRNGQHKNAVIKVYKLFAARVKLENPEAFKSLEGKEPSLADMHDLFVQTITSTPARTIEELQPKVKTMSEKMLSSPGCKKARRRAVESLLTTPLIIANLALFLILMFIAPFVSITAPIIGGLVCGVSLLSLCISTYLLWIHTRNQKRDVERECAENYVEMSNLIDEARKETPLYEKFIALVQNPSHDELDAVFSGPLSVKELQEEIVRPAVKPPQAPDDDEKEEALPLKKSTNHFQP